MDAAKVVEAVEEEVEPAWVMVGAMVEEARERGGGVVVRAARADDAVAVKMVGAEVAQGAVEALEKPQN